jgi:hypothetical protein
VGLWLVDGFAGRRVAERLEVYAPEKMSVGGEARLVRVVMAKQGNYPSTTVLLEESGRFLSAATPRLEAEVKRSTREEFTDAMAELAKRKP